MGKAAVELPDPLEKSAGAANAGSADDLLSQLAGDEIDRLLSEAEVEKSAPLAETVAPDSTSLDASAAPAAGEVAAPATTAPAGEAKDEMSAQLDALFDELKAAPIEVPKPKAPEPPPPSIETAPAATAAAAPTSQEVAAAPVDAVAKVEAPPATNEVAAPAPMPTAPSAPAQPSPAPAAVASAATPAPSAGIERETSKAERAALTPVPAADESDELLDPAAVLENNPIEKVVRDEDAPLPLLLRPLEWINLPFTLCSEPVREMLGKVAILTLVNALGVLAYVLLFRRH